MKKPLQILVGLVLICSVCLAQSKYQPKQISYKVKRLTHKLAKYNKVTGARIGKSAVKSKQYEIFEKLKHKATENELYELTNHPNAIVRAYAFTGLIDLNSNKVIEVIQKNQNDTCVIKQQFGCKGATNTVIGYMIRFTERYLTKNNITLNAEQNDLIQKLIDKQLAWAERQDKKAEQEIDEE